MSNNRWHHNIALFLATILLSGYLYNYENTVLAKDASVKSGELPAVFKIVPKPQHVEFMAGKGLEYGDLKAVKLQGAFKRPVMGPILDALPVAHGGTAAILSLQLVADDTVPQSPEGYVLVISDSAAKISARDEAGLFYGCQTLEQLLQDSHDTATAIPACKITDYPTLSYRAAHFDIKHHLDSVKYYYDSIDRLASYKVNAVIFEWEDKLAYQRQPLIGAPQAISMEEMAALAQYAQQRHIDFSPLVQGLGHAAFILKHEAYAHLREQPNSPWTFCPLNEGTYQVLFDMYRDAIEATPSGKYIHIGGDEVGGIGLCPRCKPTADKEGNLALQLYWLNRVCEFAMQHGRIPIFWDDMPLRHAEVYETTYLDRIAQDQQAVNNIWEKGEPVLDKLIDRFPKGCVYMRWNYGLARQLGNIRVIEWYRKHNLKAMGATAVEGMTALMPNDSCVDSIQSFNKIAGEHKMEGMLCTAWDDSSPHMETYWRGLIAQGEYGWNPTGRTAREYEAAYLQRELGPACTSATNLYNGLHKAADFWTWALYAKGERVHNPGPIMDVPDLNSPGKWSLTHHDRLAKAEQQIQQCQEISVQLADLLTKALRNRYSVEILTVNNDIAVTAPRLLLALKSCDVADNQARQLGMKNVQAALDEFDKSWASLKTAYAKVRFLANPPTYVRAQYTEVWPDISYLADKRRDISWMIMPEQQYHLLIRSWLKKNGE